MPHTEKLRAAASRSYPSRSGKKRLELLPQADGTAAAMCRCVRQLLPERLRRVKVAQACRAFLAAAQRGREHAAGIGERWGRKLCRPRRQLQRPAVREAPLRRPDKAVPCIAGPQAGEDRQRFRRKGVISRGQQHRGIPEPPLQALRHGAVHGAGRAQKIQTTPPAAPGRKPVQRLLRNALRQDGVVDDGHMSLQRARRDAGPAIRQKAEAEHGGPAGKCCNFFTICRQIHRNRQ